VERRRGAFQDMAAEGLITIDELRGKLKSLDEIREGAEREVEKLHGIREHLEFMERERDFILGKLVEVGPQARAAMTPDRAEQYRGMNLRVMVDEEGHFEIVGGVFVDSGTSSSWWPHDNLHISNGNNLQGLLFIEYGFHFTLMIAALVLAYCFLSLIRQRSDVMEPPAARVR
jgi:hypothetical protein